MIKRLIGLTGYAGSGKDTVCELLYNYYEDVGSDRVAFADKMKLFAADCFGLSERNRDAGIHRMDWFKDEEVVLFKGRAERHSLTGRQFLQNMGPAARNSISPDFWIDLVLPKYTGNSAAGTGIDKAVEEMYPSAGEVLVVSDVRYDNEAERIKRLGGEIWHIQRLGFESDGHESEQLPRPQLIDEIISNEGTIDDLWEVVTKLCT